MRTAAPALVAAVLACCGAGCTRGADGSRDEPRASATAETRVEQRAPAEHLRIEGTAFYRGRSPFDWRGITAFRLAEMLAHGREHEAVAVLDWAAAQKLTVVRVLLMARNLFALEPADGLRVLPRLLELAAARGLYVEIVPLADTAQVEVNIEGHVKSAGTIAARHPNAIVEIANEPWHPTQDPKLHDPVYVKGLGGLIPPGVPVALGSAEADAGYAAGPYATWHAPRSSGNDGWGHVLALAQGAGLLQDWRKPVISDEPIGAAPAFVPGRRDNSPERFAAAAALTRFAGMGATFHYEGGLQARVPSGVELECFTAWVSGLDAVQDLPAGGTFVGAEELARYARAGGHRAAFGRVFDEKVWILGVDPGPAASVLAAEGWTILESRAGRGLTVYRAGRR